MGRLLRGYCSPSGKLSSSQLKLDFHPEIAAFVAEELALDGKAVVPDK
jgi:hypothetical protein